jgi:hypothetical protein
MILSSELKSSLLQPLGRLRHELERRLGFPSGREDGIRGVPEIAAGFQSLLKEGGLSAPRYSDKYSTLA